MLGRVARCFSTLRIAGKYTPEFKIYKTNEATGKSESFFHDVPINLNKTDGTLDMIVEIPRYEQGKFEISKDIPYNPIVQDTKKGKLRFINNIYPFHGYPCNYGAIPQTWEHPAKASEINGDKVFGDNDPLDICEISSTVEPATVGSLKKVKILGCLAMIDDGELDWKLLAIDVKDKLSNDLHDISDLDPKMPLLLDSLKSWFKNYKLPMGKPENEFAFNSEWLGRDKALIVVEECHANWKALISGNIKSETYPLIINSTLGNTAGFVKSPANPPELAPSTSDAPVPLEAREIFYYRS
ncbi:uncharacterized protein C5L36_0A09450 [Pichia kudriavzevii]|uniref:inorganic diphosphatase n=1 Tax=Pichia kudriavzevii TaxID=4909 RepID=A0A2U9QZB6_PICKU|nr:uncharacterized protein C5L36_0A09450 [Pichia kudriavzevii]AWU74355.1 hypothetical protein C5L36_0A09450 [Pichia kudriavzevii]